MLPHAQFLFLALIYLVKGRVALAAASFLPLSDAERSLLIHLPLSLSLSYGEALSRDPKWGGGEGTLKKGTLIIREVPADALARKALSQIVVVCFHAAPI